MKQNRRLYAAYGSNMSVMQMRIRCPEALLIGTAEVKDYRLKYKGSLTGAYATIEQEEGQSVPIVIWSITPRDEANLDRYEGYPTFYYKKDLQVEITDREGRDLGSHEVMAYIMDEKRKHGMPSAAYVGVLREGYERFGFDIDTLRESITYTRKKTMASA
jgi:hypothetical protein